MSHIEYKLTVRNPIIERVSADLFAEYYKVGTVVTLDAVTFDFLKNGNLVERYTQSGLVRFDKTDFENEVRTVTVTVEEGTVKLGNR